MEGNVRTQGVAQGDEKERRYIGEEVRSLAATDDAESRKIAGYAAVFDVYADMGWYLEVIDRDAFVSSKRDACACLHNHLEHIVLGRVRNGTLALQTDDRGLYYVSTVPNTTAGNDLLELVRGGYVYQSSFGFTVKRQTWEEVDKSTLAGIVDSAVLDRLAYGGKVEIRRVMDVGELFDVSPVTFPAYIDTTVAQAYRSKQKAEKGDTQNIFQQLRIMDIDLRMKDMAVKMEREKQN